MPRAPSEVNLSVVTENLALLGARIAGSSNVSLSDWIGEVVGMMDASGYSPAQCSDMSKKASSVLATLNNTRLGICPTDVDEVYERLGEALYTKTEQHEPTPATSSPPRETLQRTRRWLNASRYEPESKDSRGYFSLDRVFNRFRRGSKDTAHWEGAWGTGTMGTGPESSGNDVDWSTRNDSPLSESDRH